MKKNSNPKTSLCWGVKRDDEMNFMCNTQHTAEKKSERNERKENLDLSVCDGMNDEIS